MEKNEKATHKLGGYVRAHTYEFARAVVTKYHTLSGLNRNVLSHSSGGWQFVTHAPCAGSWKALFQIFLCFW